MKPETKQTEKKLIKDQKTFDELPDETRESLLLGDKAAKSAGREKAAIDKEIAKRSTSAET